MSKALEALEALAKGPAKPTPIIAHGPPVTKGTIPRDPLDLKVRLYVQISELLGQLESGRGDEGEFVTIRERIAALSAIGRLTGVLVDKAKDDDDSAGSAIRKYAGAFKNDAGRGKKTPKPTRNAKPESGDSWFDHAPVDTSDDGLDA